MAANLEPAAEQRVKVFVTDDDAWRVTLAGEDGSAWAVKFTVSAEFGTAELVALASPADVTGSYNAGTDETTWDFVLPAAEKAALSPGNYAWSFRRVDPGSERTLARGPLVLAGMHD